MAVIVSTTAIALEHPRRYDSTPDDARDQVRTEDDLRLRRGCGGEAEEEDGHGTEGWAETGQGAVVVRELQGREPECRSQARDDRMLVVVLCVCV